MLNVSKKTRTLVQLALLASIMLILEFTNLGYIKTPTGLELTIMQVPVLVGAILMGPMPGAILGGLFGLSSFYQCFGKSTFGVVLLSINPVYTFIVCFVPRLLMGLLCGMIFESFRRKAQKLGTLHFAIAGVSGALLNTVLFMTALMLFFGNTDYINGIRTMLGGLPLFPFLLAFVGTQGLIEAAVCVVAGTAISRALYLAART